MNVFSGIQPTGAKHLGNYAGGFRQYVATQDEAVAAGGEAFFCIVDLHSVSVEHDPVDLRERTLDLFAMLVATGLDPERSAIFAQSHVTAHAEANWLLSSVTSFGELRRMTQFKDKADAQEFVSAGLFTYPVLMAGDILLYQTDVVPVGIDQRQHVELTRNVAERARSRRKKSKLYDPDVDDVLDDVPDSGDDADDDGDSKPPRPAKKKKKKKKTGVGAQKPTSAAPSSGGTRKKKKKKKRRVDAD
jgi:tryptophanyl-tRNA synthetase